MRRFLAGIASLSATLLVGGVVWLSMQEQSLRVEREVNVAASPTEVYFFLNNLDARLRWDSWLPSDPDMYVDGSEVVAGLGAWTTWECDSGSGHITVVASQLNSSVVQNVEVWEPMAHRTVTTVDLAADGEGTLVTYVMERELDFMGKMVSLLADWETLLSADLERRLQRLKFEAERASLHRTDRAARSKLWLERAARVSQPVPEADKSTEP
jgi:hypothetical protein